MVGAIRLSTTNCNKNFNYFYFFAAMPTAYARLIGRPMSPGWAPYGLFFVILRICIVSVAIHAVGTYVSTPPRALRLAS